MERAKLDGIPLDCETIRDSWEKSLATYEFPYRDGALIEDMGIKSRKVSLRCYFWDETYDRHKNLVTLLKDKQSLKLQHPVYGLLHGSVSSLHVRHDDRLQTAEVDFDFVEGEDVVWPEKVRDVERETEDLYVSGVNDAMETFSDGARTQLGSEAPAILNKPLDPKRGILEQFTDLSWKSLDFVGRVDDNVRRLEASLVEVATPPNALISTIRFATDLPGRVIGSMARTANRYSLLYETLKDAPDRFADNLKNNLRRLDQSIFDESDKYMRASWATVAAQEMALQTGYVFADDDRRRQKIKRQEGHQTWTVTGDYVGETTKKIMDVREVEQVLATTREMIADAVTLDRAHSLSLKQSAELLADHATRIKLEQEKIVSIDLDSPLPLHLVCLKYGLPYQAAERIMAINSSLANPNFTGGRIDIYAR